MKKLLFSAALFAATMIGFTSCDKDDDEKSVDVREQAVGDYTVTSTLYMYDGKTLTELKGDEFEEEDVPTAGKAELDGDGMKLTADGDVINIVKIAEASNGFTFDVKEMSITETDEETGEPYTYTLNGFNGYELKAADGSTVKYHGGFIASSKTLEFYVEMRDEEAMAMIAMVLMTEEDLENFMAMLFSGDEEGALALLEQYGAGYSVVMKITCTKK